MTNLQIIQALTTVWLVQTTEMIADSEKEATLFITLTGQGMAESDVDDCIDIMREGTAEELLRTMGLDDDFFVGAVEGFNMTFRR